MNNALLLRALAALAHPLSVAALLILLLNDHWLKKVAPSWLTGKLSDIAGLVFVPFVLLALLAAVLPIRYRKHERGLGLLALFVVGGALALIKTLPMVRDATTQIFESIFGWPIIILIDPTDLLALPALSIAWHIWKQSAITTLTPKRSWPLLALSTIALVATSPPYPNLGIYCLHQTGQLVIAYSDSGSFLSEDGGESWRQAVMSQGIAEGCTPFHSDRWELTDPSQMNTQYRITPGQSIERSTDNGETWRIELLPDMTEAQKLYYRKIRPEIVSLRGVPVTTPGPYDAVVDPLTKNLIVAMGQEGVAVRTPAGQWHYVDVGPYARVELNQINHLLPVLRWELLSAVVLLFLVIATLVLRRLRSWRTLLLTMIWFLWAGRLLILPHDTFTIAGFDLALWLGLIFPALVAVPLGIMDAAVVWAASRRAFGQLLAWALGAVVLFIGTYWLWSQGSIKQYQTATFFALGLIAILVLVGRQLLAVEFTSTTALSSNVDKLQDK